MQRFELFTSQNVPTESKPMIDRVSAKYGFVPNLIKGMAPSPQSVEAYLALSDAFESSSLNAEEQQIVLLTTSRLNECEYCTSVHSSIAEQTNLEWDTIERIRNREALANDRHEALRAFTERVVRDGGSIPQDDWTEFTNQGFTPQAALDVVLGVTLKTLTNSVNHMVETPLDDRFRKRAWSADQTAKARV